MPRKLPTGLAELQSAGTRWAETHSTLALFTSKGNFFLATSPVVVDGVKYAPELRETGALKQSLTRAVDRVDCQIQNVDMAFGLKFVAAVDALHGARAVVGADPIGHGSRREAARTLEAKSECLSDSSTSLATTTTAVASMTAAAAGWAAATRAAALVPIRRRR